MSLPHLVLQRVFVYPSCITRATIASLGTWRAFSSSQFLAKEPVPHFKPTSSPELDAWLARFRDNVFIPQYIPHIQRRIIWKVNAAEKLKETPITVDLGNGIDENYRLKPLKHADIPRTRDLKRIISLMKTDDDWNALLPFLAGMTLSHRVIPPRDWEWITRKAGEAGHHHIMVACAKQPKRTSYSLGHQAVARQFFYNYHRDAVAAGLQGEELERIFRSAVQCSHLFNQESHAPVQKGDVSPKRLPEIIGVLLELSAARSVDAFDCKDFDEETVRRYAEKVTGSWMVGDFTVSNYVGKANEKLQELLPLWNGIGLALEVDTIQSNTPLQTELSSRRKELEKTIDEAINKIKQETAEGRSRMGLLAAEAVGYKT
ncbi:hypothetical protein KEM54_005662 [Ascosphaera aggregata]|nr:hypothetical protein KEM54_005662 [Ascosphaera aggregata]